MKRLYLPVFLTGLLCISSLNLVAQSEGAPKLTHWLTPEEKLRLHEIGKGFVETDPPTAPVRNVAEFDRMQGALVRYPFGIPVTIMKELSEDVMVTTLVSSSSQQTTVTNIYTNNGVNLANCNFLIAPTDSYWTRDYGPWFASDSSNQVGVVDFPYNRPRPNDDEVPKKVAEMLGIPWYGMNVIHTGGNYMTDGMGKSGSTKLVWEENPTQSHQEIADKMLAYLGIDTYHVVTDPNGTYIDHIDCWGKFLAPDKILIRRVPPTHSRYTQIEAAAAYWAGQVCPYGYNYRVFRVDTPQDQPYTNSVIVNNKVLVPIMNSTWDDSALVAYQSAMPGYEVIGFTGQPSTPWESTDALHCRVMGIADIGILYIRHIPLSGNQPCEQDYQVEAEVIACSGQPVIGDSVRIWYRVNNSTWESIQMTHTTGSFYEGLIPGQPAGSTVEYYLTAADASGRSETMPLIGAADPFRFQTVHTLLAAVPDTLWFHSFDDLLAGKHTWIHNYTDSALTLSDLQLFNMVPSSFSWMVDSTTSLNFPFEIASSDSFYVRVKIPIPLDFPPDVSYLKDSMYYVTEADTQYVIIMLNDTLLTGQGEHPGSALQAYLGNIRPNPVRMNAVIPFSVPEQVRTVLSILDLNGRTVATLVEGTRPAGSYQISWNGCNDHGQPVQAGVYVARLQAGSTILSKRIVVIR